MIFFEQIRCFSLLVIFPKRYLNIFLSFRRLYKKPAQKSSGKKEEKSHSFIRSFLVYRPPAATRTTTRSKMASSPIKNGSIMKSHIPKLPFDQCLVCYSSVKPSNCFIQCNHRFHLKCIKEWCQCDPACPECNETITNLYIETPEDCELFHLSRIRAHFSRKRLCRLSIPHIKKEVAEHIDESKDQNLSIRLRLQECIIAKHMIKFLKTKKKLFACKTDHLLEITNRQLIQIRKTLEADYDQIMKEETIDDE